MMRFRYRNVEWNPEDKHRSCAHDSIGTYDEESNRETEKI